MEEKEEKRIFINLRVSDPMKKRINRAFDLEGIDWTSLAKTAIYNFVRDVEAGKKPVLEDQKYREMDKERKTKYLQIQISEPLKKRFDEALKETNLSATQVVLPYLLRIMAEAEQKHQ
jgi:antitoxin component of RelBE/YafQ-DinJ toxin-antitoxin module